GAHQLWLGLRFDGTRPDVHVGIQTTCGQHDIYVIGIVRQTSSKSACTHHPGLQKIIFKRRVADHYVRKLRAKLFEPFFVAFHDDEWLRLFEQRSDDAATDAAGTANNVMVLKFVHFS